MFQILLPGYGPKQKMVHCWQVGSLWGRYGWVLRRSIPVQALQAHKETINKELSVCGSDDDFIVVDNLNGHRLADFYFRGFCHPTD